MCVNLLRNKDKNKICCMFWWCDQKFDQNAKNNNLKIVDKKHN